MTLFTVRRFDTTRDARVLRVVAHINIPCRLRCARPLACGSATSSRWLYLLQRLGVRYGCTVCASLTERRSRSRCPASPRRGPTLPSRAIAEMLSQASASAMEDVAS